MARWKRRVLSTTKHRLLRKTSHAVLPQFELLAVRRIFRHRRGAHGKKISYPDRIERTVRCRHPNDYLALMQSQPSEPSNANCRRRRFAVRIMMNALRLTDGVPAKMLQVWSARAYRSAKIMAQIETARQKRPAGNRPCRIPPDRKRTLVFKRFVAVFFIVD